MVELSPLRDGGRGCGRDRIGVYGAETGSKQNAGERAAAQPTLRQEREGWGTHGVWPGKNVRTERVGHPRDLE